MSTTTAGKTGFPTMQPSPSTTSTPDSQSAPPQPGQRQFPPATAEQLAERSRLGNEARRANAARLRSDFDSDDEREWQRLAEEAGVRLPPYGSPITTAAIERWLRRLNIPTSAYLEWQGAGLDGNNTSARLGDFIERNPDYPLKAWVGILLEWADHRALMGGG